MHFALIFYIHETLRATHNHKHIELISFQGAAGLEVHSAMVPLVNEGSYTGADGATHPIWS